MSSLAVSQTWVSTPCPRSSEAPRPPIFVGTQPGSTALAREVIRSVSLSRFNYSVATYPYIIDWGSVLMFGVTSVVGVSVVTYLIMVIYQSGQSADGTVSAKAEGFGRVATAMLGAWFGFFVLVGLFSSLFLR